MYLAKQQLTRNEVNLKARANTGGCGPQTPAVALVPPLLHLDEDAVRGSAEGCNPFAKESEGCALRIDNFSNRGWGRSIARALRSKPGTLLRANVNKIRVTRCVTP